VIPNGVLGLLACQEPFDVASEFDCHRTVAPLRRVATSLSDKHLPVFNGQEIAFRRLYIIIIIISRNI